MKTDEQEIVCCDFILISASKLFFYFFTSPWKYLNAEDKKS